MVFSPARAVVTAVLCASLFGPLRGASADSIPAPSSAECAEGHANDGGESQEVCKTSAQAAPAETTPDATAEQNSPPLASPQKTVKPPDTVAIPVTISAGVYSVQIGAFRDIRKAKALARQYKARGYQTFVRKTEAKDGEVPFYRVQVGRYKDLSEAVKMAERLRPKDLSAPHPIVAAPRPTPAVKQPVAVAPHPFPTPEHQAVPDARQNAGSGETAAPPEKKEEVPAGQHPAAVMAGPEVEQAAAPSGGTEVAPEQPPAGTPRLSDSIFERKIRNFHLYLGVSENYSDNVFNTEHDRQSDFWTVLSPGITFSFPGVAGSGRIASIQTSTVTPGGAATTTFISRYPGSIKASLGYRADIERYARLNDHNTTSQTGEGILQYNLRGGLSLDLRDQFMQSYTLPQTFVPSQQLDKYNANFFSPVLSYELSDRLMLRLDYSNYVLHYLADRNQFMNRTDNGVSGFVFYKVASRTALFMEYDFVDISFDENSQSNSREQHFYGGLRWDITAKTKGSVKVGYGIKDFTAADISTNRDLLAEAQLEYLVTPRASVTLVASRKTNETNVAFTNYMVTDSVRGTYTQRFTRKINGLLNLSYEHDRYNGDLVVGGASKQLVDRYYGGGVAAQYEFREWLKFDLGYTYNQRSSSFSDLGYTNNMFYLKCATFF